MKASQVATHGDQPGQRAFLPGTADHQLAIVLGRELPSDEFGRVALSVRRVGRVDCSFEFSKKLRPSTQDVLYQFQRIAVPSVVGCDMTNAVQTSPGFLIVVIDKNDDIDVDLMKAMLQPPTLGNASSVVSFLYLWVYSTGLSTTKNFCLFNPKIGLI